MFRHLGVPSWIVAIILAVSFARGLPSPPPVHHIEEPFLDSFKITINNITYDKNTTECVGKVAMEIGAFFFANFITHAFTIRKGAGDKALYVGISFLAALFLPYYGLLLACRSLESCANQKENTLKRAGRGGGLCVVARTKDWRPRDGERVWCWRSTPNGGGKKLSGKLVNYTGLDLEYISQEYVEVHGFCHLPRGYMLARLPTDCKVVLNPPTPQTSVRRSAHDTESLAQSTYEESDTNDEAMPVQSVIAVSGPNPAVNRPSPLQPTSKNDITHKHSAISSNFNAIRPLTAFTQLITAGPLIYGASGSDRRAANGYAGYELTILPFLLMSILNTISSIATPDYGAAYMIRSSIMKEAEGRGGTFDGVFGALCESEDQISLPLPLDDYDRVIGGMGRCKAEGPTEGVCSEGCVESRMEFDGGDSIGCPGKCVSESEGVTCALRNNPKRAAHAVKKGIYFMFKHQLWEGLRQELPVIRWILAWTDQANVPAESDIIITPVSVIRRPSETFAPNTSAVQIKFPRFTPPLTAITRLFKSVPDEEGTKPGIILFPAIGNAQFRKGSKLEHYMFYITDVVFFIAILAPYLITYILTDYTRGHSSRFERVTIVVWLVLMQMATIPQRLVWNFMQTRLLPLSTRQFHRGLGVVVALGAVISAPGMIGFYLVFRQLINLKRDECDGYFRDFAQTLGFRNFGY